MDSPSNLEHMLEETRDNIHVACFLLKIRNPFEVCTVLGLVGCTGERDIDMFTCDPLVKVTFDLKEVLRSLNNRKLEFKAYHCQYKSDRSHWKRAVLGKLWMYNTVVILILEPDLVDDVLYERGPKNAGFRYRILSKLI
jgi:hypothetical protein